MKGIIAAGGPETVAAGAQMMEQGGNAVDAAVAAAFASFIAEIGFVHLGGSGMAQIFDEQSGRSVVYDFFSDVPGRGRRPPATLDFHARKVDFGSATQVFHIGRAAVAVPGNIIGLCQMAAEHARLPFEQLLEPAIALARDGLALGRLQAETCAILEPLFTYTAEMREVFYSRGRMIRAGERLFIPNLAGTLTQLAAEGSKMARNGALARAIASDQARNRGLVTTHDLASYQVRMPTPIRLHYRGHEVLLPPPSSIGGALIAFAVKLLSAFDVSSLEQGSARHLKLLLEIMAATSRARHAWENHQRDSDGMPEVTTLLDDYFVDRYKKEVRKHISEWTPSRAFGEPKSADSTSHISVIDRDGLAVSLTTTAGESAGYIVPGTGYIPNNIMGEEDLHPMGFHRRPPGERIPTMITPTIVLRDGKIRLVLGSGGSIRIRSAILQVLSNLLDFGMTLEDAVNCPRVHLEDGILQCEAGFDAEAVDALETSGCVVNRWHGRSLYFGGAHSVSRTESGRMVAAGDSRRGGATAEVRH